MNVSHERIRALSAENARLQEVILQLRGQLNDCEYALNSACADVSELQTANKFMHEITTDYDSFVDYAGYFAIRRALKQPASPQHYSDTNYLYNCNDATTQ